MEVAPAEWICGYFCVLVFFCVFEHLCGSLFVFIYM